jgi:hypothetical protein
VINPMEVGPMSEDYKGPTWDQWAQLTARVEALEADQWLRQHAKPEQPDADPPAPPPAGSLVARVSAAIVRVDEGCDWTCAETIATDEARAAIREVAVWLREGGDFDANAWASLLEQEAER